MKKVILFIDNLGSGGAQRQISNIGVLLKQQGYDVSVLVYQDIPFYKPLLDKHNVPVVFVESKNNLSRVLKIRRFLNKAKADAVICFLEVPCFIGCVSRIGRKKWKLITTERSAKLSTFTNKRNKLFNWFERFSAVKVGNSSNAMRMWEKYYPEYKEKYRVIYNILNIPTDCLDSPHTYLVDGKLHLTVAASYQELKNPLRVIEAVNLLSDEQKARLDLNWYGRAEVCFGDSLVYEKAIQKIKEYDLDACIHLNDETSDIYDRMSQSDVVGLFSTVEGLPNAICEAMAIGRPVIMSRVSDYEELVSQNGVLCDPYSVESIKNALERLLSLSADELKQMGETSRVRANELFSREIIMRQWIDLIES